MIVFKWAQRIAAILFIPLLLAALYGRLEKEPVEYMEVSTSPGMITVIDLPDGSKVWLNSESTLRRPVKFTGSAREVSVAGEAYFRIAKDTKRPFIVSTGNQLRVEVLGTEFNIEAYKDDNFIATTLVKGSIRLSYEASDNRKKVLVMQPDRKVFYCPDTKSIKSQETYVSSDIAWIDGKISFRDAPLELVLKKLSHRFNVDFTVRNENIKDFRFTGTFDRQQLVQILEHFRISSNIQYRIMDPPPDGKNIQERCEVILF